MDRFIRHTCLQFTFLLTFYVVFADTSVEVLRPRGVSLSRKVFYTPGQDFNCIDGSDTIPFSFVNDDYCDCDDGSDEPGTSACSNTFFHCVNSGHLSLNIPSSRVNDNICDCCDGSDEYNSTADCLNICLELGKQALQELQKQRELFENGHILYQTYSSQGKNLKEENKNKLEDLKAVLEGEEKIKLEMEVLKNAAEEKEKAALDVYKAIKEEQAKEKEELEMIKHQEEEKVKAEEAFKELDLNDDKYLSFDELQKFPKFDSNSDGEVSVEEAKFFLHMKDLMDLEEFVNTGWMIMKPVFEIDKQKLVTPDQQESPVTAESEPVDEEDEDEEFLDDNRPSQEESDDELYVPETELPDDSVNEAETAPAATKEDEYDEETRQLINVANEARTQYKEAADKFQKIQDEIKQLEGDIHADFGQNEEFAVLKGQCFDFEDREYTYRFCPFDKASQITKTSGSDSGVNLGRWGSWAGPENNRYMKMKYENGQTCWNGPARSVMVLLQCGLENKLLSSSEPNRCEYLFEFITPALCSSHSENGDEIAKRTYQHTEL